MPIGEIFASPHPPVILKDLAYVHPSSVFVGQSIQVLPVPEEKGSFSRRLAIIEAANRVAIGDTVLAGVTEISTANIYALTDMGFDVRVPVKETEDIISQEFLRRLNLEGEEEESWLYVGDRIQVQIVSKPAEAMLEGRLVVRGRLTRLLEAPSEGHAGASPEPMLAPVSLYKQVLIINEDVDAADSVDHFFRDGGCATHWLVDADDVSQWLDGFSSGTANPDSDSEAILALVRVDSPNTDWQEVSELLIQKLPYVDTILTYQSADLLQDEHLTEVRSRKDALHILGQWDASTGLEALSAVLARQSGLSQALAGSGGEDAAEAREESARGSAPRDEAPRYHSFVGDCRTALEALCKAAGDQAAPCAAILFEIHKNGHAVNIVATHGDNQMVEGFQNYRLKLHKSPIRDLAIYRQDADTDNARKHEGRYVYFLAACGWNRDLSVLGLRPVPPPRSPFCYAAFLFSGKKAAFADNPGLSKSLLRFVRRSIELALLGRFLDQRCERMRERAERASDYEFLAHEATGYLRRPLEIIRRTDRSSSLRGGELETVRFGAMRTHATMTQLLPGQKTAHVRFSPNQIVKALFELCQQHEESPDIPMELDTDMSDGEYVYGRRLAFECALRNLVLNARQQIQAYCPQGGRVKVSLRLIREKTGGRRLVAAVTDDGPGIHEKHRTAVFESGVSTRPGGTGLGLAVSRRLVTDAKGELQLSECCLYGGATFQFTLPVVETDQAITQGEEEA